jgi:hypothetical protein
MPKIRLDNQAQSSSESNWKVDYKFFVMILACLLGMAPSARLLAQSTPSLLSQVREKYKSVKEVRADFEIENESKSLSKPLKSSVRYTSKAGEMTWTTTRPIKTQTIFKSGEMMVDGLLSSELNAAGSYSKQKALYLAMDTLLSWRWGELFTDFSLKTESEALILIPKRADLVVLFERLTVLFDPNLQIKEIEMKGSQSLTRFLVRRYEFKAEADAQD